MAIRQLPTALLHVAALTLLLVAGAARAQQPAQPKVGDPTTVTIDEKSIGGVVTSRFGPEALWVLNGAVGCGRGRYRG